MSLPTRDRPSKADNPFLIFSDSSGALRKPIAVHPSVERVTPKRPATNPPESAHLPTRTAALPPLGHPVSGAHVSSHASPRSGLPAVPWKKPAKGQRNAWKQVVMALLMLFLVFALLPVPLQKRCYAWLGLRSLTPVVSGIQVPVPYAYISSPFGRRWGRMHQGIDLAASYAAPIYAIAAGTVVHSGWEAGYGNSVVIDHGHGVRTRYAHCSRLLAAEGAVVQKGALIARVGSTGHSTGPHLHFEVIVNGVRKNPAWYYRFPDSAIESLARAVH
jgi:murein DD-endopeptidase MepM/ murein hydrolase activator NlpD